MTEKKENQRAEAPPPEATGEAEAPATEEPERPSPEELIQQLTQERDDYLDHLRRERAAFLNYKRIVARERPNWEREAVCAFVARLLPFLDDLERAVQAAESAADVDSLKEGFLMIARRFQETLRQAGIAEVPAEGQRFDPSIHEAVLQVEDAEVPPGTVVETVQRGFRFGDRLIRPAKVVVSQAPAADQSPGERQAEPNEGKEVDDADI